MCHLETDWSNHFLRFDGLLAAIVASLQEMKKDGLVEITTHTIRVTEKGRPFVRNICMAFDVRLHRNKKPETRPSV